jgi:hypothetical protein
MECDGDATMDFCSEPECVNSRVTYENNKPHLPTHGVFKVHRIIFHRDVARIENRAEEALNYARGVISQLKEGNPMPECVNCKTPVSLPCWSCVECTGKCWPVAGRNNAILETPLTPVTLYRRRRVHM